MILILVLVVAAGAAVWANSMITPAHRAGQPTTTIAPIPSKSASASPTPTPKASPTPTPSSTKKSTMKSSGKFEAAGLAIEPVSSTGKVRTYAVRVETSAGLAADKVATQLAGVLNDPRSWAGNGSVRFALVADTAKASFIITVASPKTAAKSCTIASGTCLVGTEVVLDALAWKNAPATFSGSSANWQSYLANHGVGTLLGKKPAACTKKGKPAPVMMAQQTNLGGCTANPWPYP